MENKSLLLGDRLAEKIKNGLFVWVPKVAGTSIATAFLNLRNFRVIPEIKQKGFRNRGFVTFAHADVHQLLQSGIINNKFFSSAFKFGFVRNPFDRALSLFSWFKRNPVYEQLTPKSTFKEFCTLLKNGIPPVGKYNFEGLSQANPQSLWICGNVDFIGRYENLEKDFAIVCAKLGVGDLRLPWKRKRVKRKVEENYYNNKFCKKAIQDFYEQDFKIFGYDIDKD